MRAAFLALSIGALAACDMPVTQMPVGPPSRSIESVEFKPQILPRGVSRSNLTLAEDFLDLTFALESGQSLPGLLRYEGPVRVYIASRPLVPYVADLEALLERLRKEAGIDIRRVNSRDEAQIHIVAVSTRQIQRVYPGAACFIVPGETNWAEFRNKSRRNRLRWSEQATLGTTAIFIPSDGTPQDIRDCLHEEIAQALGPANDVYRLADSVFNDDNFHSIVTPFDMLMLRTLYSPQLQSGMTKAQVAARVGSVLNGVNPRGRGTGALPRYPSSPQWKTSIETAMTRTNARPLRIRSANRAVDIARSMTPVDHRLGVALLTRGRLTLGRDPARATADFASAYNIFRQLRGQDDIRTAQAALHMGVVALRSKNFEQALELSNSAIQPALKGENGVLASGLYAVKSEALSNMDKDDEAKTARLESLKWARYAFGDLSGVIAEAQAELETFVQPEISRSASTLQ